MNWIRVDNEFFTTPKNLELMQRDPLALLGYLGALCWSSRNNTDGRLPESSLRLIVAKTHSPPDLCEILLETGHLEEHENGVDLAIVNYLEWQESCAEQEERRRKERDKKRRQRACGNVPDPVPEGQEGGHPPESPPLDIDLDLEENPSVSAPADDGFEDFWKLYPARDGKKVGKGDAHTIWKRMSQAKRRAAMIGVENYADSGWKPKDAHRWLRKEEWTIWQTPAQPDHQKPEAQVVY